MSSVSARRALTAASVALSDSSMMLKLWANIVHSAKDVLLGLVVDDSLYRQSIRFLILFVERILFRFDSCTTIVAISSYWRFLKSESKEFGLAERRVCQWPLFYLLIRPKEIGDRTTHNTSSLFNFGGISGAHCRMETTLNCEQRKQQCRWEYTKTS